MLHKGKILKTNKLRARLNKLGSHFLGYFDLFWPVN